MKDTWFLKMKSSSQVHGPYTAVQLQNFVEQHALSAEDTLVSQDQANWNHLYKNLKKPQTSFGNYQIFERLGQGGMGVVYRAKELKLNRECALKVLLGNEDSRDIMRFIKEARAVGKLHHPNIVTIYEIGSTPQHFFAMEYIKGMTLAKFMHQKPPIKTVLPLFLKICQAVTYAHENKIIHRDLKLANIMLDERNEPKVMDFGIAKLLGTEHTLSKTGEIVGTPKYMAPEVANGLEAGKHSDVYSLGVILYEILTGRVPFDGENVAEIFFQLVSAEPIPPTQLNPSIPKDLEIICLHCLQKSPEKRYQNVKFLSEEIQRVIENKPILTKAPGILTRLNKWTRRHPLILTFLIMALILIGIQSKARIEIEGQNQEIKKQNKEIKRQNQKIRMQKKDIEVQKKDIETQKKDIEEQTKIKEQSLVKSHFKMAYSQILTKNYNEAAIEIVKVYKNLNSKSIPKTLNKLYLDILSLSLQAVLPNVSMPKIIFSTPIALYAKVSSKGKYLVAYEKGNIYGWEVEKTLHPTTFEHANFSAACDNTSFCISFDESKVYFLQQSQIKVYNRDTKQINTLQIKVLPRYISALEISPDSRWLFIKADNEDLLFDIKTQKSFPLKKSKGGCFFYHDSSEMARIMMRWIEIHSLSPFKSIKHLMHYGYGLSSLKYSHDKLSIVYGDRVGNLYLHKFKQQFRNTTFAHKDRVTDIEFSNNGRLIATCSKDGYVFIQDASSLKLISKTFFNHIILSVQFTSQDRFLKALVKQPNGIFLYKWRIEPYLKGQLKPRKEHKQIFQGFKNIKNFHISTIYNHPPVISPKSKFLIMGYHMGFLLWKLADGQMDFVSDPSSVKPRKLIFSPDEKWFAYSKNRTGARIYNLQNLKNKKILALKNGYLYAMTFSRDSQHLLFGLRNKIGYYHLQSKTFSYQKIDANIHAMEYSPSGKWLVLDMFGTGLEVWKNGKQRERQALNSKWRIRSISWHPDEKKFGTLDDEKRITIWELKNNLWQRVKTLSFPDVDRFSFSPKVRGDYLGVINSQQIIIHDMKNNFEVECYNEYYKGRGACIFPDWNNIAIPTTEAGILIFRLPFNQELFKKLNQIAAFEMPKLFKNVDSILEFQKNQ